MITESNQPTLLLVDDNKRLTVTLTDFLSYEGFNVASAKSGEEAIKKLKRITPDIIILDINMPGIGGVGFLNILQKRKIKIECPILVFTARSTMEDFFETLDVAGFISKPCSETALLAKIKDVLATNKKSKVTASKDCPKIKVLIGEDDPVIINQLNFDLKQNGFDFKIMKTAGKLIENSTTFCPNVIVLNDVLPGMSGRVVASLLRAMPSTRQIPIILYDETRMLEDESRYGYRILEGITQYLTTSDSVAIIQAIKKYAK